MIEFRHIAVEGVPGAGKTAVATALAKASGARVLLDSEENPFLAAFLQDMSANSFQTQIWFLLTRYRLEDALRQPDLFQHNVVTDYVFDRDEIYATLTLNAEELLLYRQLYGELVARRTPPDLVLYLQISLKEATRRCAGLDPDYVKLLVDAYNDYFFNFRGAPLAVVKADGFDPVSRDEDMDELMRFIESLGEPGKLSGGAVYLTPRSTA